MLLHQENAVAARLLLLSGEAGHQFRQTRHLAKFHSLMRHRIEGVGLVTDEGLILSQQVSFALGYWTKARRAEDDERVRAIVRARVDEAAKQLAAERGGVLNVYAHKPGSAPWLVFQVAAASENP